MWLILTEPFDPTGPWLSDGLAARTGQVFSHFTSHDIGRHARYEHGTSGEHTWFRLHTADGSIIDSRMVRGVVNCLVSMPPGLSARLNPADRTAAVRNFNAPLMRWLHRFTGPVVNRPNSQGLCGDIRLPAEWAAVAESSGLSCLPHESVWSSFAWLSARSPTNQPLHVHHVVAIGERVLSLDDPVTRIPTDVARSCARLAAAAQAHIQGIDLTEVAPGDWRFVATHRNPDLKHGGTPVLDAIIELLDITPSQGAGGQVAKDDADERDNIISAFSALTRIAAIFGAEHGTSTR